MKLGQKKEEPEIPTASMADIAFLLIVFFMLTTVFSANKGMEHVLPPRDKSDDVIEPEEAIYIKIFPGGQFEMDQQTYSMDQVDRIYNYVYQKIQVNSKKPIIVHTNEEAPYGSLVQIIDQLKRVDENTPDIPLSVTIPSKAEKARYVQTGM
jgi:biopolymer transport protein ExbD